jgi:hypothetical protein
MKNEQSILVFTSISLLALAIFTSYHTPQLDRSSETEYLIDIENYKREVVDRISIDNRRMTELNARFEIKESVDGKDDEDELAMLKEKINEMKTVMNNYEVNGLEDWEFFKTKFENNLTELHESLINLIIKTSYSLNSDNSIQSFVTSKP